MHFKTSHKVPSDVNLGLVTYKHNNCNLFPPNNLNFTALTLEEMTAQSFVFFAAGFETAASTTSFSLYELALNRKVQDKLQLEIDQVLSNHSGDLSYQALKEMKYMDQVVNGQ